FYMTQKDSAGLNRTTAETMLLGIITGEMSFINDDAEITFNNIAMEVFSEKVKKQQSQKNPNLNKALNAALEELGFCVEE
ncbi:hypothetical protein ACFL3M_03765, partial [Patescibacteria group bacterium]